MKYLIATALFLLLSYAHAQQAEWYEGMAIMSDGSRINGMMNFHPILLEGRLIVKNGGQQYNYAPHQVLSFQLKESDNKIHKYQSFPITDTNTRYTSQYFLKILYESRYVALLSRKSLPPNYNIKKLDKATIDNKRLAENLFILTPQKNQLVSITPHVSSPRYSLYSSIEPLWINKKIFYKYFDSEQTVLKQLVKENNLNIAKVGGLISLLGHYTRYKEGL